MVLEKGIIYRWNVSILFVRVGSNHNFNDYISSIFFQMLVRAIRLVYLKIKNSKN